MNDITKTKKIKRNKVNTDIWKQFDLEIKNDNPIECIYRQSGEREICDNCKTILTITDEGFMACQNSKCGIIYKDIVDQSAEWRFYGADDNHNIDPTRCGLPINPLLQESSYGCKVICSAKSTYEMRKIRRYTDGNRCRIKKNHNMMNFKKSLC